MNRVETNLTEYLPGWFRDILEFQTLCQTETEQFETLAQAMGAVADNFFFQTMDAGAVSQWEQVFGIGAVPSEILPFRRTRLLNRISTRPPFTLAFLYERLDALIGPGKYTVEADYPNYALYIETAAEDQSYFAELSVTINTIKPCHIVYIIRPLVASSVLVSEEIRQIRRTYNYRLGSWALGKLPFATEENLGVIKMPNQPSIQPELLNALAGFTAGDIAGVRINGTMPIPDFTKSVKGNQAMVTYTVASEQTSAVTQAELLDVEQNVLASFSFYVPVVGSAQFKHTFTVKEGN